MMSGPVYVTADGLKKMKEDLRVRVEEKRVEIAHRLHEAIKMGDLKENADYHVAKEDQAFNEGKIQELQDAIIRAEIITETADNNKVRLGATVIICEPGYEDEEETYRIVGAHEADPGAGLISNESPIGRSLLGARKGQVVQVKTPGGAVDFKIVDIK